MFRILVAILYLITISHQFELECSFERVGWDDVIGPAYTCKVQNLNVTTPRCLITAMEGRHPLGESNENVNTLLIIEQTCEFFPIGIGKYFKKLEGIAVQKSGLKKITKYDLKDFVNLKSISLFGNELKTIESNLFMFNPKLKLISVFNNKLKHIFSNIFDGLDNLERVYFRSNPCISEDGLNAEKIEQLKCKFIESCSVTDEMKEYAEVESEKLKNELENEKLKENLSAVTKNFISTKRKLESSQKSYNLMKNELKMTDSGNCESVKADLMSCENDKSEYFELIQEMDVVEITCDNHSKFETTSRCKAIGLKVLKPHYRVVRVKNSNKSPLNIHLIVKLEILDQQTLFLPLTISNFFPMLKILSVKNSHLITINEEAFNGLDSLTELNLSYNKLSLIKTENFVKLTKLLKLDLSHNKIEFIESAAFRSLINLIELRLNHNLLIKLSSKFFSTNDGLKIITLHNNSLNQIASNFLEISFDHLELLDFSNNLCIDSKFPETSLVEFKENFIVNCTLEIEFECRFEVELDYFCHAKNVDIESRNVKIKNVKGDHKLNLTNLDVTFLKVINQSMRVLPQNLSKFFPNLKSVWIENSKLNVLESESFKGFSEIEELIIKSNFFKKIGDETFDNLVKIQIINLSFNSIEKLSEKAFEKLTSLKSLNLSHNKLTVLKVEIIPAKNVIETFDFNHNQLTSIDPQIIKLLKSAKLIDFKGNKCISSHYDQTNNDEKKVMEIFGEISFKCIED